MNDSMTVLLEDVIGIVRAAGERVLEVYRSDFEVRGKVDASPVTEADERAEALILQALAARTPQIPVISEEAAAAGQVPEVGRRFWLVDPLDGTKEFINRNGEFTVIDQGDIDGEGLAAAHEAARAVQRIDQPEPVLGRLRRAVGRHRFLRNRLHARIQGRQPFQDQGLGRPVGLRHRTIVRLGLDRRACAPIGQDQPRGFLCDLGDGQGQRAGRQIAL